MREYFTWAHFLKEKKNMPIVCHNNIVYNTQGIYYLFIY